MPASDVVVQTPLDVVSRQSWKRGGQLCAVTRLSLGAAVIMCRQATHDGDRSCLQMTSIRYYDTSLREVPSSGGLQWPGVLCSDNSRMGRFSAKHDFRRGCSDGPGLSS